MSPSPTPNTPSTPSNPNVSKARKAAWQPVFDHEANCETCLDERLAAKVPTCETNHALVKQARKDDSVATGHVRQWPAGMGEPVDGKVGEKVSLRVKMVKRPEGPDRLAIDRIVLTTPPGSWSLDAFEIDGRPIMVSSDPDPEAPNISRYRPFPATKTAFVLPGQETVLFAHKIKEGAPPLGAVWIGEER